MCIYMYRIVYAYNVYLSVKFEMRVNIWLLCSQGHNNPLVTKCQVNDNHSFVCRHGDEEIEH